jgi:uncharacterized alkaline shock family protein YloU
MIRLENHLGIIEISQNSFPPLSATRILMFRCGGLVANSNARQGLRALFNKTRNYIDQGVDVHKNGNGLTVDLHIIITYGLNISATVKSIVNKVRYTVEEARG